MSNLMLNDFSTFFPKTWKTSTAYESTLYILDELKETDEDYVKIKSLFNKPCLKIHRVQHPIAYLRYLVHSEFLANENITFEEKLEYMSVSEKDVDTCLSYNCDPRVVSGNPIFTSSPNSQSSDYIIIVNKRTGYNIMETDKNHYPLYAVQFSL